MMTPFERAVRGELEGSRGGRAHVQPEDDGSDRATPLSGTQLRPQPRQPPRLAHQARTTRTLAGPPRRAHRRPAPRQGHEDPRPRQTPKRLTGPARTTHPAPRQRQPARKRARDSNTGPTAYEIGTGGFVDDQHEPRNGETPGQMSSGREFRQTETGSSRNYPRVRKGGFEPPRP